MVKAELVYNPYMLETEIRFNGQPPRINSLVEKYQEGMLQDWISALPGIFHDEMNGYDFELEFTGTSRDFNELQRSFKQADVTEEQVKLFHKSELENRDKKLQRIESLLNWLAENPNRNFDNDLFRKENELLFDGAYSFILIQGENVDLPKIGWADATIEVITDVRDLENTDLTFTPVVISVDQNTVYDLQRTLKYLKRRRDVVVQQVFFIVDETMNQDSIYRTIKDLGIKKPHIIKSLEDEKLKKYFEIYPETDYIMNSIKMFKEKADAVGVALETEREQCEKTNTETDEKIRTKAEEIQKALEADEELASKSNIDKPAAFTVEKNNLDYRVAIWRKKKTKSVEHEEAEKLAIELQQEVQKYFEYFSKAISDSVDGVKTMIDLRLSEAYAAAGCEDGFDTKDIELKPADTITLPDFHEDLMKLHVEELVRKSSVGLFYIPSKNPDDDYEMQTAYYMQKWRTHILSIIGPIAEALTTERMQALSDYDDMATEAYHNHLMQIIDDKKKEEEKLAQQLSSEEKQLQQDGMWLNEFKKQLKSIARG